MRLSVRTAFLTCLLLVAGALSAFAETAKTFAVLPFQVNGPVAYKHLEQAIPQMLTSRLYWKDNFVAVDKSAYAGVATPSSQSQAQAALQKIGVDYLVYGSTTIIGDESSIDVQVVGKDGSNWPRSATSKVDQMIPTLKNLAEAINSEVFKREEAPVADAAQPKMVNQMNPAIQQNQLTANQQVYLNPQFRYAGETEEGSRLRSNALKIAAHAMVIEDLDGDGKNEVLLLTEREVGAYSFDGARLTPLATFESAARLTLISMRAADLNRDGIMEIVISAVDTQQAPQSMILNYQNGKFSVQSDKIRYLLSIAKFPPDFMPVLLGQRLSNGNNMWREPIYEMVKTGGGWDKGRKIDLPDGANLFNFVWLPASNTEDPKFILLEADSEHLRVYSEKFARLAETDDGYSGASIGLEQNQSMRNMGKDTLLIPSKYFIPLPMIPADFDNDGRWELLVNKPVSVAAQFFDRYRFFPQGEIHSLYWDGVGLGLQWKTRRIKGSVVAFDVKDVNNDGIRDLVVCINTHPGNTGMGDRKTMLLAYPLDMSQNDPSAETHKDFKQE
ncbi:VCBS repeat-containing protein [Desulfovibrio mangrovi]|uniref:FG-GAP-like repeat-containing protein n=1 Tax=Desulfovibrio mangrovi TaxID=2976983 RepID=UPI00224529C1|nr:FG-GAP-like repeat-containing protein [Desulfovibrio mangrovi]UZP66713.1 VCBS repeat-containing protein [Desulfovibrio mangrovi]